MIVSFYNACLLGGEKFVCTELAEPVSTAGLHRVAQYLVTFRTNVFQKVVGPATAANTTAVVSERRNHGYGEDYQND